jgi:hypothetical protein
MFSQKAQFISQFFYENRCRNRVKLKESLLIVDDEKIKKSPHLNLVHIQMKPEVFSPSLHTDRYSVLFS